MIFIWMTLIVGVDQWTKKMARTKLSKFQKKYILGNVVSLRLVENKGAFLGWLKDKPLYLHMLTLVALTMIMVLGLPYWLTSKGKITGLGLAFIFAGAVGNYLDRAFRGSVTDFVAFKPKHKVHFNVADFAIFKGAFLMVLGEILSK